MSSKNCTAQILSKIPATQQQAFVEYSHWQEPHLENMAEQPKHFVLNAFTLEDWFIQCFAPKKAIDCVLRQGFE